jgi:hypothetical protein
MNDLPSRNLMGAAEADLDQIVFNHSAGAIVPTPPGSMQMLQRLIAPAGIVRYRHSGTISTHFPLYTAVPWCCLASSYIRSMVLSGLFSQPFHGDLKKLFLLWESRYTPASLDFYIN